MESLIKTLLPYAIHASIFLVVCALGLRATPADAAYLFARPGLLFRSLLSISVVVPIVAELLVKAVSLTPAVAIGIVLMAISPLPPMLPNRWLKMGSNISYVVGMLVAVSLCSVILVPVTVSLFSIFGPDASVAPLAVARIVALSVVLPLGLGIALNGMMPKLAARASGVLSTLAVMMLVLALIPVLGVTGPKMWALVGNGTLFAIIAVVVAALAAGQALGGPDPNDRTALAIASALRHPGIALVIARSSFDDKSVQAAVLLFVIVAALATIPYQLWRKHTIAGAAALAAHPSR